MNEVPKLKIMLLAIIWICESEVLFIGITMFEASQKYSKCYNF